MKCKYCGKILLDFNEVSKNDPRRKELNCPYQKSESGYALFCNNPHCQGYKKVLMKGFEFDHNKFLHIFFRLSRKGRTK